MTSIVVSERKVSLPSALELAVACVLSAIALVVLVPTSLWSTIAIAGFLAMGGLFLNRAERGLLN